MSTERSSEPSNPDKTEASNSSEKSSTIFFVVLAIYSVMVMIPTLICFTYGGLLFGTNAFAKLLLLSGMGGALSTSICTKGWKQRFIAILPGTLIGIGFPVALTAYVFLLHRHSLFKIECVLPLLIGILPGFILYAVLIKPASSDS